MLLPCPTALDSHCGPLASHIQLPPVACKTRVRLSTRDDPSSSCQNCVGQSNDGIFKYARAGKVTCKVDKIQEVLEHSIVLSSGQEVPADVIVFAYGLKYQAEPKCLRELGIGMTHPLQSLCDA